MRHAFHAVLLALVLCAPAEAATTVAREGAFTLHATERGDRLCITLRRDRRYRGVACGRIPRSPHRPLTMFPDIGFNNYAAAVPASVRFAETESRSGRRERHRTFAARGFTARFVLVPAPPAAVFVRFYSAGGRLLGVEGGPAGYIGFENQTPVSEGVEAHTEPLLSPTPDDPGRLRTIACIDVTNGLTHSSFCDRDADSGLVVNAACEQPDVAGALVATAVAAVRVTLGSGAEVTLAAGDLPAVFGGRRALSGRLPAGEAVREAVALDAAGAVIGRTEVGTEPAGQPCAGEDSGGAGFSGPLVAPAPGAVEVASAGGESLLAGDQGERLCVGLGRLRARPCPFPPVDSDRPRLHWRNDVVAGALSQDAARITLRVDRGRDVTVATTPGAAYSGRWAGRVRFFAAALAEDQRVTGAVVRNARGRIIGISRRVLPNPKIRVVRAERGGRGVMLELQEGRQPCLTAFAGETPPAPRFCTDLNPGMLIDGPYLPYGGAVTVPCSPPRAIAYGRMPDRFQTPVVRLAGGETVRARRIRLRGEDGWLAFLPDAGVRGLRGGRQHAALALPPASAQCGYSVRQNF
jgi:hypothetical protein